MTHRNMCLALVGTLAAFASSSGCKDDIADPTMGTVQIQFSSPVAGTYLDGTLRVSTADFDTTFLVTADAHEIVVPAGQVHVDYEKECTIQTPTGTLTVEVEAAHTSTARLDVVPTAAGIRVESSMEGADVFIDGVSTGRVTPTTLECMAAGTYSVSVTLLGADPEPAQEVQLGTDGLATVTFDLDPIPQLRGAVMEVLTATECAPCGVVDIAAEEIWKDSALIAAHAMTLEIHHRWQGIDAFFTPSTVARNDFYGASGGGLPIRVTNGITRVQGSGNLTIPELVILLTAELRAFIDAEETSPISLHWTEVEHQAGTQIRAVLRVVMVEAVASPADAHVLAMDYKHNLTTYVRIHDRDETFYRIVRDIKDAGSLQDLGLVEAGDWADVELVFDLSTDTQWSEEGMGLVGMVQDLATQEVFQVRHRFVE